MPDIRKTQRELQKLIGQSPRVKVEKFTTALGTQDRQEVIAVTPTSVEHLQAVIKAARKLSIRVRAVGEGLASSPLYVDEGNIVVYVKDLKRADGDQLDIIEDKNKKDKQCVVVGCGVTVDQFKAYQLEKDLCVPANVTLGKASMVGVVNTGCHGVGWDVQTISDSVEHMRIVDSDGEIQEYSKEQDEDLMAAAQCGLGMFGVIVDITFQVEPMKTVVTDIQWIKMNDLLNKKKTLKKVVQSNWSVEMSWFPFSGISKWEAFEAFMEKEIDCGDWEPKEDAVWLRIMNIPKKPGKVKGERICKRLALKQWIDNKGLKMADDFITKFPQCAPSFLKSQADDYKDDYAGKVTQKLSDAIHYMPELDGVDTHECEWSFGLQDDCSDLCKAVKGLVELIKAEAKEGRFPVNLPVEIRFMKDSDALMSPAVCGSEKYGGPGHSCHVTLRTLAGTPHWQEFCVKVKDTWSGLSGLRPHWSSAWDQIEGMEDLIKQAYSDQIPKFTAALDKCGADPDGIFLNQHLERILYPDGHPGWSKIQEEKKQQEEQKEKQKSESSTCSIL